MHTEMNISSHQYMLYFIHINIIACKSFSNMATHMYRYSLHELVRCHDWTPLDRWLYQNRAHAMFQSKRGEASTRAFWRPRERRRRARAFRRRGDTTRQEKRASNHTSVSRMVCTPAIGYLKVILTANSCFQRFMYTKELILALSMTLKHNMKLARW